MFQLLTRNQTSSSSSHTKDITMNKTINDSTTTLGFDSSQTTAELSFEDDSACSSCDEQPACTMFSDYESDSLVESDVSFEQQTADEEEATSSNSTPSRSSKRGGLKRTSTTASTAADNSEERLSVRFSQVEVRTYAVCVGDNPAVSLGVPISLDWTVVGPDEVVALEDYDRVHPNGKVEAELAISAHDRSDMVRRSAATTEEIRNAVRIVNQIKMEREQTLDTLKSAASQEFMEKLGKSLWNATIRRKSKKMEKAQLQALLKRDAMMQQRTTATAY